MSEKTPTTRKTNRPRIHLFGSNARRNKSRKNNPCLQNTIQDNNDIHYEKETLLERETARLDPNKHQEKDDKKHKLSESLKNAGKTLLPHLGSAHRHKKLARQSTIDIGDIKSAIKEQETKRVDADAIGDETSKDAVSKAGSLRSLAHLDLAEVKQSQRRTATCDELEKFTVVSEGKTLHTMRKDLLTFQRLKEWSFL
jgi:hypothetical protein